MSSLHGVLSDRCATLTFSCISKLPSSDVVCHGRICWIYIFSFSLHIHKSWKTEVLWNRNEIFTITFVCYFVSRTGYIKVFQQSVVHFSLEWKQKWSYVVGISSNLSAVYLLYLTVTMPHKQDQYRCTDTTPFFFTIITTFLYLVWRELTCWDNPGIMSWK